MLTTTVYEIADNIKDKFGVEPDLFILVKRAAEVIKHTRVGALQRKLESFQIKNYEIELPCNVVWVASVTSATNYLSPKVDGIELPSSPFINDDIIPVSEFPEFKRNYIRQPKGLWVDFKWVNPFLRFNETDATVWVEYIQTAVDEEGFPIIPKVLEEACEYEYMYHHFLPQFLAGKMQGAVYQEIQELRRVKLAQAVNRVGLSRNELSVIFDNVSTFDRKSYRTDI